MVIHLADSMPKHVGSHPYICLTTALFVAGSEALGRNRDRIKDLLDTQYQVTNSRNTLRALQMLDKVWSAPGQLQASCSGKLALFSLRMNAMLNYILDPFLEEFVPY